MVTGGLCTSDPAPAGFSQVVSALWPDTSQTGITIDPSAMPAGTELSLGAFPPSSGEQQADVLLIDTSSYTCSSTPPDPNGLPDGYGPWTASGYSSASTARPGRNQPRSGCAAGSA